MRRYLILALNILLVTSIMGCSLSSSSVSDTEKEILIITAVKDIYGSYPTITSYIKKFEAEKGVKVNVENIEYGNYDDYIQKLNIKLYMKEGPELILFPQGGDYGKYIDAGIALNIKGKVTNYDKIYDSLKYKDSFVPVYMYYSATALNKSALDELGVKEPNINWTLEEYSKIKEQWIKHKEQVNFNYIEYRDIIERPLNDLKIIDRKKKTIHLNNSKIKDLINHARGIIFSGNYILKDQYTYMDYYNVFFDYNTDEYFKTMESDFWIDNTLLERRFKVYGLKSYAMDEYAERENVLILPTLDTDSVLSVSGFIINKNSRNIELAIDFLNGLLCDEIQLSMFNSSTQSGYPVNKDIEEKIEKMEIDNDIGEDAVLLRKFILEKIKNGEYKPYRQIDSELFDFRLMLHKDLIEFIFSEKPYSDKELGQELQRLEYKYIMWLNE